MRRAVLVLMATGLVSSQAPPRFSSDVQLVQVDVQAADGERGQVLEWLSKKDFEIYDDGRPREIRGFHFATSPADVVFLIYGRSGVGPAKDINAYRRGLRAAPDALATGDQAAVIRTDSAARADLEMTENMVEVRHALLFGGEGHYRTGHGHLYDAVAAAAELLLRPGDPGRRRAVVAITDDIENGSKIGAAGVIRNLVEADAVLDEVVVVRGIRGRRVGFGGVWGIPRIDREIGGSDAGESLRPVVEATGGEATPGDEFETRFPDFIRRIRMRYLLSFYVQSTPETKYHRIEVRLAPEAATRYPHAVLRARAGYYSGPATAATN